MIITVLGYDKDGRVQRIKLDLTDLAKKMSNAAAKKQLEDANKLQPKGVSVKPVAPVTGSERIR